MTKNRVLKKRSIETKFAWIVLLRLAPCNPLDRSFHSPSMTKQGVNMTNLGLANGFWFALRNVYHFEPLQKGDRAVCKAQSHSKKIHKTES